jgi:holo-[acyl-carrier protein] synthase
MKLASGVDIIEIERVQAVIQRHGERFLQRVFTPLELAETAANPASLAARFAAKEAVAKALGSGIGRVGWQEIEIRRGTAGEPQLILSGMAQQMADELRLETWSISLSHTHNHAVALVVALGAEK